MVRKSLFLTALVEQDSAMQIHGTHTKNQTRMLSKSAQESFTPCTPFFTPFYLCFLQQCPDPVFRQCKIFRDLFLL